MQQQRSVEAMHSFMLSGRVEQCLEAAGPILNNLYKRDTEASKVIDYFKIIDTLQACSIHRIEHPVKSLILFHSLHAALYYAIWHGLYDTLTVLAEKIQEF